MKVLLINDKASAGGAEVQHWREYDLLESKGHSVYSLTFDEELDSSGGPRFNIPIGGNQMQKLLTRASSRQYRSRIRSVISEVGPDVVHVANAVKAPLALFGELRKYPCVQTIRDYGAICPKSTCIHPDYSICAGIQFGSCQQCGMSATEKVKHLLFPRIDKARKAAVDVFVAPSQALADACTRNGMETKCLNNPFDFGLVPDRKGDHAIKRYFYYGVISEAKGVKQLARAFYEFSTDKHDVALSFAGRIEGRFSEEFHSIIDRYGYEYLGNLSNREVLDVLGSVYCVVVPSLWIENYPNTVLEPLASEVLVIGSDRGGIPELIQDRRFLFDVTSIQSMVDTLVYTYGMSAGEYKNVAAVSAARVRENNSPEKFYSKLLAMFELAVKRHKERA